MPQATQLLLGQPLHGRVYRARRGQLGHQQISFCLAGDGASVGSDMLTREEWKIPLTMRTLPEAQAHQLSSRRTWHAPECLSTPFRKGHGTWLGRGMQAAWATSSAESRCSWKTVLQPAQGSESWLEVQRRVFII